MLLWLAALGLAHRASLGWVVTRDRPDLVEAFLFDTATTVPALHVALCLLVLWHRRVRLFAPAEGRAGSAPGLAICGLGLVALVWSRTTGQVDLEIDSLSLMLAGSALGMGGLARLEQALLPLALLMLGRPLPPMLTHHVHEGLQRFTARFTEVVLSPFAEVVRSGHVLSVDGRLFEVIEGCSGLRLELTLISATLVYAAFVSRGRRQTLGLVALAALLGPLLNGLRVLSIVLDPESSISETHSTQGLILLSAGIVLIGALDALLERRVWPTRRPVVPPIDVSGPRVVEARPTFAEYAVAAVAGLALLASLLTSPRDGTLERGVWGLHEIRPQLGRWRRVATHDVDREFMGSVQFGNRLDWSYAFDDARGGTGEARIFVAADDRRRRDRSAYSPKTRRIGSEWETVLEEAVANVPGPGRAGTRSIQTNGRERWLSLHYRIGVAPVFVESLRWWLALDLRREPIPEETLTVRLDVRIDEGGELRAQARLDELARAVGAALERARPAE